MERAQQRRGLELVLQVERGGGFVEQQDGGLLRRPLRAPEICASAAAMITRCFSPPLSVENMRASSGQRAGRRQRGSRQRDVARSLDLERAEVRIAAHQDDFEHAVFERELRLLRHDRHAPRDLTARERRERRAIEAHAALLRLARPREQPQQGRLAGSVRADDADETVRRHLERHAAHDRRLAIPEREVSGLEQCGSRSWRGGRARGSRAPLRRCGRRGSRRGRRSRRSAARATTRRRSRR